MKDNKLGRKDNEEKEEEKRETKCEGKPVPLLSKVTQSATNNIQSIVK